MSHDPESFVVRVAQHLLAPGSASSTITILEDCQHDTNFYGVCMRCFLCKRGTPWIPWTLEELMFAL